MTALANLVGLSVIVAVATACSTASPPAPISPAPAAVTDARDAASCALGVGGAHAFAAETAEGVDVTFTSTTHPEEVRLRAQHAARMYGPDAHLGEGHEGRHGEGGSHGLMPLQLPPVHVRFEEVPDGARLFMAASDAADVGELQARARARVLDMNKSCR